MFTFSIMHVHGAPGCPWPHRETRRMRRAIIYISATSVPPGRLLRLLPSDGGLAPARARKAHWTGLQTGTARARTDVALTWDRFAAWPDAQSGSRRRAVAYLHSAVAVESKTCHLDVLPICIMFHAVRPTAERNEGAPRGLEARAPPKEKQGQRPGSHRGARGVGPSRERATCCARGGGPPLVVRDQRVANITPVSRQDRRVKKIAARAGVPRGSPWSAVRKGH